MDVLEIDSKRLDLLKRSNKLLEKTKKEYMKYERERRVLLELTRNKSIDYDEWENILISIENLVDLSEEKTDI